MKPAHSIEPPAWMKSPEITAVVEALSVNDSAVRFVGGCVRDLILGVAGKNLDIDIATPHHPEEVMKLLQKIGTKILLTGFDYGTVTAITKTYTIQITTLRCDIKTFGRKALVSFTDDWLTDAQRRDFTINAIYLDAKGIVYDPVGGLRDLEIGFIRFVGDPVLRIKEDVLRILRFYRFLALYAQLKPDAGAVRACADLAIKLNTLSNERITKELLKILSAPNPCLALSSMVETGVLQVILPEATRPEILETLYNLELAAELKPDPILRLSVLVHVPEGKAKSLIESLIARLSFTKKQIGRLKFLLDPPVILKPGTTEHEVRTMLYYFGYNLFSDLLFTSWARYGPEYDFRKLVEIAAHWDKPKFPITRGDLKSINKRNKSSVGKKIKYVEEWWVESNFIPNRQECLGFLDSLLSNKKNKITKDAVCRDKDC